LHFFFRIFKKLSSCFIVDIFDLSLVVSNASHTKIENTLLTPLGLLLLSCISNWIFFLKDHPMNSLFKFSSNWFTGFRNFYLKSDFDCTFFLESLRNYLPVLL
jgi:hypothetical protein